MKLPVTYALSIALVSGCAVLSPAPSIAIAELAPTAGNRVSGPTTFVRQGDKILVDARLKGLKPGRHGFHIHENGNCSGPDASAAGGHFNPAGTAHGDPASATHHRGDLGNIVADANGNAVLTMALSMDGLSFAKSGSTSIIGRVLIVHADPDDMTTQPSGNTGKPLACGVIVLQ